MESKKTFGGYIYKRRRELGMTQKEFSQKLYVTESAVSKWERGLSYPDITMVPDICSVLDITEHELLTARKDMEQARLEQMAEESARTIRHYRLWLYVILAAAMIGCAMGSLVTGGRWFPIAVSAAAVAASLLLVPLLLSGTKLRPYRLSISLGCTMLSIELLLFSCCVYAGWPWVISLYPVLLTGSHLAGGLLFLPVILHQLPLPEEVWRIKALAYTATNCLLLLSHLAAVICFLA